jgi:MoxR-like ATPase
MSEVVQSLSKFRKDLEKSLKTIKPNSTYKTSAELKEYLGLDLVKGTIHAIETGQRYRFIGEAGIGKTSFMKWICEILGLRLVVIPAAQISIENLMVPFPVDDEEYGRKVLEWLFYKHFEDKSPYVIYIDEPGRADSTLGNTLMELLQEGTLGGKKLEGLVTVVATDNPEGAAYGKMAGLDFAQADRFATVILGANGTPWRRALAEEFADIDLSSLYTLYARLDEDVRRVLNPRVLGNLIPAALEGFPLIYSLPVIQGERVKLVDKSGADRTEKVLNDIAAALGVPNKDRISDVVEKAINFAVRYHKNIFIEGAPGIGKTSYIKSLLNSKKIRAEYDSAPMLTPEDMSIPFPSSSGQSLELMPNRKYLQPGEWVYIVDEVYRGSRRTQSALMPVIQEHELGGEKLPGLLCTIALNNPKQVAGMRLDVGRADLAQATRYALSLQITAADIPSSTYLYDVYGEEIATPFVEWWQDDLDDVGRALCTPRCLERMIKLHTAEGGSLPLQWALPYVNGEYVGVPLVELQARLDKQPLARLRQIVAKVDEYESLLSADRSALDNPEVHATVYVAFSRAEQKQLEAAREVCVRLLRHLDQQHRINLIRADGWRQQFWFEVLKEATA